MNITTVRIQSYTGHNPLSDCTVSCDLRCPNFLGAVQDDHHHTLLEWDVLPNSLLVEAALAFGPTVNKFIKGLVDAADPVMIEALNSPLVKTIEAHVGAFLPFLASLIEEVGHTGLRVCILDKIAPPGDICP